ncbi:Uncharacterized protein HZ326_21416 [Fusarium oxysporum f. sp. albedinis]|nr:Uncharacterized protein HZ326_21416 [Fusarium oxysporum f. sp. albedinis]
MRLSGSVDTSERARERQTEKPQEAKSSWQQRKDSLGGKYTGTLETDRQLQVLEELAEESREERLSLMLARHGNRRM